MVSTQTVDQSIDLTFSVRTDANAVFSFFRPLSIDATPQKIVDIRLGLEGSASQIVHFEGTKSTILDEARDIKYYSLEGDGELLSRAEQRWFWVTWERGRVQVGKGKEPGSQVFLEGKHLPAESANVGVASMRADAKWEICMPGAIALGAEDSGSNGSSINDGEEIEGISKAEAEIRAVEAEAKAAEVEAEAKAKAAAAEEEKVEAEREAKVEAEHAKPHDGEVVWKTKVKTVAKCTIKHATVKQANGVYTAAVGECYNDAPLFKSDKGSVLYSDSTVPAANQQVGYRWYIASGSKESAIGPKAGSLFRGQDDVDQNFRDAWYISDCSSVPTEDDDRVWTPTEQDVGTNDAAEACASSFAGVQWAQLTTYHTIVHSGGDSEMEVQCNGDAIEDLFAACPTATLGIVHQIPEADVEAVVNHRRNHSAPLAAPVVASETLPAADKGSWHLLLCTADSSFTPCAVGIGLCVLLLLLICICFRFCCLVCCRRRKRGGTVWGATGKQWLKTPSAAKEGVMVVQGTNPGAFSYDQEVMAKGGQLSQSL
jgi:hypothetical protein